MKTRSCKAQDWSLVTVGPDFHPSVYDNVTLEGFCELYTNESSLVNNTQIIQSRIEASRVVNSTLEKTWVRPGARVVRASLLEGWGFFGWDARLLPGNEAMEPLAPLRGVEWEAIKSAPRDVLRPFVHFPLPEFCNFVGGGSTVQDSWGLRNVFLDEGTHISVSGSIEQVTFLTDGQPCRVLSGSVLFRSVLQGTEIASLSQIRDCHTWRGTMLSEGVLVKNSLLGPGTEASCGEITASVVGSGIGFHHRSLLIAVSWPEGLGNVASGAQVGSNHTSRKPDASAQISEGWYFGLNATVKFPLDLTQAPFGLVAAGEILPSCRLVFPFSLIGSSEGKPLLKPGWVLARNLTMVFRSESKWRSRLSERRSYRVFRPQLVEMLGKAWRILQALGGKVVYGAEDAPELNGWNLTEKDRVLGMASYQKFMEGTEKGEILPGSRLAKTIFARLLEEFESESPKINPEEDPLLQYFKKEYLTG